MLDNIFEARLFGWTIAKAQSVLKLYNKDLSEINLQHAMSLTRVTIPARLLLNEGDKNYSQITKAFTLARKTIHYETDYASKELNIIAFPDLIKDGRKSVITFVIHNDLWRALLDLSKGYRLFNLETYLRLSSKYSIIMYLLVSHQSGPKSYTDTTLRQILGCQEQKSYDKASNFFARCIDPVRKELIEKAPWYFEYSANKDGRAHKITEVIITPVLNAATLTTDKAISDRAQRLRLRLDEAVQYVLTETFRMTPRDMERVEPLLMRLGDTSRQLDMLATLKLRVLGVRVKNRAGYLVRALQNHFR